ncbi:embryonic polyadenylate-binding protein 2-like [Ochotona princeps]|uniref:embryonic polyadenylate-binding protein 2-like n=1 Tax=Ochotona princeps TaxID=9978 RepID=UPI002714B83B|nr:embryonic polyadenylate-binding protein 2-like [Ochotona princeps]
MWPFLSRKLFPPPSETWLQVVSSDPKAQGWGAWGRTEKTPVGADAGHGKEQEEDTEDDAGLLLALLEPEHLAQCPVPDQELEAIQLKLWAMEQAEEAPEAPGARGEAGQEEDTQASQLLSSETSGCSLPRTPKDKVEADHRSIYVGNVDYGGTAEELEAYFNHCGEIQRVTILCDKFSRHPKGCRGAGRLRYCPKGPTSQESAPLTAGSCGSTTAPGQRFPSATAASWAGLASDPEGRTGAGESIATVLAILRRPNFYSGNSLLPQGGWQRVMRPEPLLPPGAQLEDSP